MKASQYNYIISKGEKIYCFNGISKLFFVVPIGKQDFLKDILNDTEGCKSKLPSFYNKLVQGGFVIEGNVDEVEVIKEKQKEASNSAAYQLTILPTLDCNFKCWYCYEKHNSYMMSEETLRRVKKYIFNILDSGKAESFHVDWFGGEPFLGYDQVIKPISISAKKLCEERNIPFSATATSNGFLITEEVAKELSSLGFTHFQVTLDGEKSLHDKTRVAKGTSSFETILKNMNAVCKYNPNIGITLRINYDDRNFQPNLIFDQITELVEEQYQHHFSFLIRKVWQIEKVNGGKEKIEEFFKLLRNTNFRVVPEMDFNMNFLPCYAARKNMKMITPYGSIGKCTTKDDFEEQALGYLTEEGNIQWKHNIDFDEIYATPLYDNERCRKCKQLPLCMGVCPKEIKTDGTIPETDYCRGKVNDLALNDVIANFCEIYDK